MNDPSNKVADINASNPCNELDYFSLIDRLHQLISIEYKQQI